MGEIEDVEAGGAAYYTSYYRQVYKNQTDALKAYFGTHAAVKITPYITGQFKKIMRTARNNNELIARLMTLFTPYTWEWSTIRGCCQSDWQHILYPIELYSDDAIGDYEDYYMGCYMEYIATYKGESCGFYYSDRWDVDDILKNIASCYNSNVEIVYDSYYN